MLHGFTRKYPPLRLLSEEEIESIHRGALYTLERTGMRIEHKKILKLLEKRGCSVDYDASRVRMPSAVVEECVRRCPNSFPLRARDPERDVMVGGDTVHFMQGMGGRYVDMETWETRAATAAEHRDAMIVADALEHVHLAEGWEIYTDRAGIPPVMGMLENLASAMRYSSKTQVAGNIKDTEIFAIRLAQAVGTDLLPEIDCASPLTIFGDAIEATWRYIDAGIAITPAQSCAMGSEAPATYAGAVVLAIALGLGWLVVTQTIKPGAPMAFHYGVGPMDMRRGGLILGSAGEAVSTIMMNQMLRRYGVPSWCNAGFASNSKKFDYQAAYEKAMPTLIACLSGGNLMLFHGGSSVELLYHPVLSILDDDIAGWIGRFIEGVNFTEETLAIDLINQVGPVPGHYLGTAHTRAWWQEELWQPKEKSADFEAYPVWVKSGKKDSVAHAKERMEQILATHEPLPLTTEQEQAVEDVLVDARACYRDNGSISDEEWKIYRATLESGMGE